MVLVLNVGELRACAPRDLGSRGLGRKGRGREG